MGIHELISQLQDIEREFGENVIVKVEGVFEGNQDKNNKYTIALVIENKQKYEQILHMYGIR